MYVAKFISTLPFLAWHVLRGRSLPTSRKGRSLACHYGRGNRPARPDDEPFLCDVYAGTRQDELACLDWTEDQKAEFLKMQFAAQHTYYHDQYAAAQFQIILADDEPVGRLYVDRRDDEIRIVDIALLPDYRGAGIGTRLLKDLLAEARAAGKPVGIHVERYNPALRLYERLGFERTGDNGVYYLMTWSPDGASTDGPARVTAATGDNAVHT